MPTSNHKTSKHTPFYLPKTLSNLQLCLHRDILIEISHILSFEQQNVVKDLLLWERTMPLPQDTSPFSHVLPNMAGLPAILTTIAPALSDIQKQAVSLAYLSCATEKVCTDCTMSNIVEDKQYDKLLEAQTIVQQILNKNQYDTIVCMLLWGCTTQDICLDYRPTDTYYLGNPAYKLQRDFQWEVYVAAKADLSDKLYYIVFETYRNKRGRDDIAAEYGVEVGTISRWRNKAIKSMQRTFRQYGFAINTDEEE